MEQNTAPIEAFMSPEINEISAALSAFQGSIEQPKLEKEVNVTMKSGGKYSFKYADLSACAKAAAPALKESGLAVTQIISGGKLITLLTHKSGQWIKSELFLPQQTNDYQSYGSAITYLKRYSYCAILGIVADTDDDANMACGNQADVKDRRSHSVTGEQAKQMILKKAIAEMNAVKNDQEFGDCWTKWSYDYPAICNPGTEFYNAAARKKQQLNEAG